MSYFHTPSKNLHVPNKKNVQGIQQQEPPEKHRPSSHFVEISIFQQLPTVSGMGMGRFPQFFSPGEKSVILGDFMGGALRLPIEAGW